jgi:hypothetical protein
LLFQTGVNDITSDLQKDIQRMDDRLTQLQGGIENHNFPSAQLSRPYPQTHADSRRRRLHSPSGWSSINHTWTTCLASKRLGDNKWTNTSNRWANLPRSSQR